MVIYITISHRDHRLKPAYSKVCASPQKIRRIISHACDWYDGRCYHDRGKYLKLFLVSDFPSLTMDFLKSIAEGSDVTDAEISYSNLAEL